ncbi:MAG: ROK family protein [Candidatus Hydrogenedens sp.]
MLIGIEIGGTKLQVVLGDEKGNIYHLERGTVQKDWQSREILDWVTETTKNQIQKAEQEGQRVQSIGIGFGGPVDSVEGKVLISHQITGWQGFPLRQWFEDTFSIPTVLANDANSAGWAEFVCGRGKGTRNFFYMNIGSGIGGALIIDGKLHDGQGLGAGEIGHTYVPDWTQEERGAYNKLENICSGWSIERRLQTENYVPQKSSLWAKTGGNLNLMTCVLLGKCAEEEDSFACEELDRIAQSVGIAISNVITLFHPEKIALGGGVSLMGDVLLNRIRAVVDRLVFTPFRNQYEISPCELGEQVVLVGALLLAGKLITP